MKDISRLEINEICIQLRAHGITELADKLEKADVIPKLYVYTYFKKVYDELRSLEDPKGKIDPDNLVSLSDENPKLQLYFLFSKGYSPMKRIMRLLYNGFEREGKFCDFDDSKFAGTTRRGFCENESHEGKKTEENLTPMFMPDDNTYKYEDNPEWWCQACVDASDGGDCDIEVSCDME